MSNNPILEKPSLRFNDPTHNYNQTKKRALLHLEITNEMKREEKSILTCRVYFFPGMRNQERFGRFSLKQVRITLGRKGENKLP